MDTDTVKEAKNEMKMCLLCFPTNGVYKDIDAKLHRMHGLHVKNGTSYEPAKNTEDWEYHQKICKQFKLGKGQRLTRLGQEFTGE